MHTLISCLLAARPLNVALMRPWEMSEIEHSHWYCYCKTKTRKSKKSLALCKLPKGWIKYEINLPFLGYTIWKQTCVPDLASLAIQGGILKGWPQFFGLFDPLWTQNDVIVTLYYDVIVTNTDRIWPTPPPPYAAFILKVSSLSNRINLPHNSVVLILTTRLLQP